jgi:hypothetical protein
MKEWRSHTENWVGCERSLFLQTLLVGNKVKPIRLTNHAQEQAIERGTNFRYRKYPECSARKYIFYNSSCRLNTTFSKFNGITN